MNNRRWTKAEITILKAYYHILPAREIAKMLNRTENAIRCKAYELGIIHKRKGNFPKALRGIANHIIPKRIL